MNGTGFRYAIPLFCLLVCLSPAFAQVADMGQIEGTVRDSTGAVLPGVTVKATAVATNRARTALTNDAGRYTFPALPIGQYTLHGELPGFKTTVRRGISLRVQEVAVVDLVLEVGEITETIEVTAAQPLLETTQPSQGQVIDSERIQDLPLNGRDYVQLALLSEGTIQPIGGRFGGFSTMGQRTQQNNYMLNGVDNNELQIASQGEQAEVVKPIVDAVEEFKVQTNAYAAEFGKAMGGVLNLKVKSGTNEFHGSAWEFLRNDDLDARDFFNTEDQPKAPFIRNQFGGSIGGPIVKNKLFFFHALEWQRRRESATVVSTLPTVKMRQGDFSELPRQIFDPATFDPKTGTRQPFPNNQIPENRIDPIARRVTDLVPAPQNSALSRNFSFSSPRGLNEFKTDNRVDWNLAESDNFAFTFDFSDLDRFPNPSLPALLVGGGQGFVFHGAVLSTQWNHTFNPHLITSTKAAWNRRYTEINSATASTGVNLASELGLKGVNHDLPGAPVFGISGFRSLGGSNFNPNLIQSQNRQVTNDTTLVKGNHQIQFGVNVQRLQSFLTNPQQQLGNFQFNGNFTRNPKGNVGGNAFADFLLGIPSSTTVSTNVFFNMRGWHDSGYLQDTWKASPNLTVTLGVRYEIFLPWQDKKNGLANFDTSLSKAPRVELILAQDGSSRASRSLIETDSNNFAPRIGLAYRIGDKTVIRTGYGIFYATFEGTGGGEFLETNLPFKFSSQISTDSIHPEVILEQGVPAVLTPENVVAPVLSSFDRDFDYPFSQQWNLNIQHTFARDWLVQVGYFGSGTHHLVQRLDLNAPPPGPGNINQRRPFKSVLFPGSDIVISPLAGFNSHTFSGNSTYHSGQAKVEKRFSEGFTILSSYIFSQTIGDTCAAAGSGNADGCGIQDVRNLRAQKSLDNQHRKHRYVASYIWELPFGQGRRLGGDWGGFLNALLGGWSTQGIVTLSSGEPFSLTVRGDPANVGGQSNSVNRPNLVGDPKRPEGVDKVDQFFNTAAFEPNAPFTFGNAGRNILTGPKFYNWDFALFKRFSFTEEVALQFRFEAFNFTNTPHFDVPGNQLRTANFGQISSTSPGRKLQFGLKILF